MRWRSGFEATCRSGRASRAGSTRPRWSRSRASCAASRGPTPPDSFTARCLDPRLDEGAYVERVLAATGAQQPPACCRTTTDVLARLDLMLWHMDEPFHGPSVYGHWKVMELAQAHRRDGAPRRPGRRRGVRRLPLHVPLVPVQPRAAAGLLARSRSCLAEPAARLPGAPVDRGAAEALLPRRLRARRLPAWIDPAAVVERPPLPARGLSAQQLYGVTVSPLPAYLHHEDRNSMTFALEARVPYLDYSVVEAGLGARARRAAPDG